MGQYEKVLDFLKRYTREHTQQLCSMPITIWGAGNYGRLTYCAMVELGFACDYFVDSSPEKVGEVLFGLPIYAPETVLGMSGSPYFIIVAVADDIEIGLRIKDARGKGNFYLMMCSEIRAEQDVNHAARPINQIRIGYSRNREEMPTESPLLGSRYKNDGMRIVPLDGFQDKALRRLAKWLSSCEESRTYKVPCLCGSINFWVLSEKDRYGISLETVLCKECGLVMQNPRMSAEGFRYFNAKYFADINFINNAQPPEELFYWRKKDASPFIHKKLKDYLPPEGTILEIGCAAGSVVEYFNELGYKSVGIDLDERYISYGQSRGLELYCCDAEGLLKGNEGRFDIIILEHVIEHLVDLERELLAIKRLLKPEGYVYVGAPGIKGFSLEYYNFDFLNSLQLMHLFYWDKDTFLQTMCWYGLHAVSCDEHITAILKKGNVTGFRDKVNYSGDILQFLLHLERHRLGLQKGTYSGSDKDEQTGAH